MTEPTPAYWRAWQRRIAARLFPYRPVPTPEPMDNAKLVAIVPVLCNVSITDRFRLFFTGRCEVLIKSVVENGVPGQTTTGFAVLPPREWACDPPSQEYPAVIVLPSNFTHPVQVPCPLAPTQHWLQGRAATLVRPVWDIGGIYDSEAMAVGACEGPEDFVVPFRMNEALNTQGGVTQFPLNIAALYFPARPSNVPGGPVSGSKTQSLNS